MSMTEEGPSGDYRTTMQRDHHGRWIPIKGERAITTEKGKGGKTKLLRRVQHGTRGLFDRVSRSEPVARRILSQSAERRRGIVETTFEGTGARGGDSKRKHGRRYGP